MTSCARCRSSCSSSGDSIFVFLLTFVVLVQAVPSPQPLSPLSEILRSAAADDAPGRPPTRHYGVPVYNYGDDADAIAAHMENAMPFVLRAVPGMQAAEALWTSSYLESVLGRGAQINLFAGEHFRNTRLLYTMSTLTEAGARVWWREWGRNASLLEQADAHKKLLQQAGAESGGLHSMYLQTTATVSPFILSDLALFNESMAASHLGGGQLRSPLIGDPSVFRMTIPECRFGLRGTRIEVIWLHELRSNCAAALGSHAGRRHWLVRAFSFSNLPFMRSFCDCRLILTRIQTLSLSCQVRVLDGDICCVCVCVCVCVFRFSYPHSSFPAKVSVGSFWRHHPSASCSLYPG
jgi:hypothetical protein